MEYVYIIRYTYVIHINQTKIFIKLDKVLSDQKWEWKLNRKN